MNRIHARKPPAKHYAHPAHVANPPHASLAAAALSQIDDEEFPYASFAPLHYERNYAYPLVVWLHGPGDNESQLKRIMPLVSMRNYVAIAPRGTAAVADSDRGFDWRQTPSQIETAERRVLECIARIRKRFHLAADRMFIAGYDSGGTMALRIACRQPRMFSGVLSLGGAFPEGFAPLAQLSEVRRLSIFLACNRAAVRYPSVAVCRDLRLLHSAGMSIVLREYPGPDGIVPQMLSDMDRWMMEQITGVAASPAPASAAS